MRVVVISDTHGLHDQLRAMRRIPYGDVLVHAGDFTNTGEPHDVLAFNAFLGSLPHKYKLVIAGNHEATFHRESYERNWQRYGHREQYDSDKVRVLLTNALYLEDQAVLVDGFLFYGSPWQPEFCNWAFNLPRGEALAAKWRQIPDYVDMLVTHGPPQGHGDLVVEYIQNDEEDSMETDSPPLGDEQLVRQEHVGCSDLLREIQTRVKPTFHVFGHVHEGYGASTDGVTTFLNASSCTSEYEPENAPMVVQLTTPRRHHDVVASQAIQYDVLLDEQLRVCSQN